VTHFRIERDTLTASLVSMEPRIQRAVNLVFEHVATFAESEMRAKAPWTDRTGSARAGLRAVHLDLGSQHAIVLYHTMPYGFWLEVAHDGKYAIIGPTQRQISPQLERLLQVAVTRAMRGAA
jgi:hypothetical protein